MRNLRKASIVVIDGQGGRMGSLFIEKWKKADTQNVEIIAVGTNSMATAAMLRAGADRAATGENPVVVNVRNADCIVGPVGILAADALLGEITPAMANAVGGSQAYKFLIPVNTCGLYVAGVGEHTLNELVDEVVEAIQIQTTNRQ